MKVTASSPSRLLKITAVTARWILGLLIAAWLLFALVVVVLHGWIVPRIGQYRGALEAQATRSIGVPVRIGAITAQSEGWMGSLFPSFELRDVVLLDEQQREALRLARVVASVSPRSLWRLSFEQLYIERPEVDVRMDALGKFHVAGLDVSNSADADGQSRGADWLFSQREFAVQGGTVRWTDERRAVPPLLLTDVNFTARNSGRRHELALEATPPEGWGQRLVLRGGFRQPLLSMRSGNWQTWSGQIYADLPHVDVTRIGRYVSLDAKVREGEGAVRLWADVEHGRFTGAVADLGLTRIDVTLDEALQPLVLRSVTGRVAASQKGNTFELATNNLQFDTRDGVRWPGGNLWLQHTSATGKNPEHGALRADKLDLGMLAQAADRLPLGSTVHRELTARAPRGLVERIDLEWNGPLDAPTRYQAKGRVSGLSLASEPGATPEAAGRPGVSEATVDFDATHAGGQASFSIAKGALDLPGVFEDPVVPIDELSTRAQWKIDGDKTQVQLSGLRFANADAQGEAQVEWHTSDPAASSSKSRFPGVLDLQGKLTRADGTRVFRYLPLHIPQHTRDYVREAVTKGTASSVDFRVKGDLYDMPFMDPRQGTFRIAAKVQDVSYAYVPASSTPAKGAAASPVWPALTATSGELIFERAGMQVRNARGRIAGARGLEITKGEAEISDMSHHAPVLKVDVQANGPLGEVLRVGAPLAGPASEGIAAARATGEGNYKLRLELPLEAMDKSKVQASVTLADNDLQVAPEVPTLSQVRGTVNFTENGFSLAAVRARLLGGDMKLDGKGRYGSAGHDMSFHSQGTMTAEGMAAARDIGWLSSMGRKMTGATAYTADFGVRDGVTEFSVSSNLQGLGLQLPQPLVKAAEEAMPLRIEKKVVTREAKGADGTAGRLEDRTSFELGRVASATWLRDLSGAQPRVINGGIAMGLSPGDPLVSPPRGVLANLNLARFDIDAWKAVFNEATGKPADAPPAGDEASPYLPTLIAVRAKELRVAGRKLSNVVLGGSREGPLWKGNIDSNELSGYVEYGQAQAGRLHARLARLKIERSEASEVESLLDERASSLPALDIVVDDFELFGRKLGRAEVEAVNRGGATREWRLNRLSLITPEGAFNAQGSWAVPSGGRGDARRTSMVFRLDITDAGGLLNRMGMKDVLRRGRGRLEGDVAWLGSPFSIDYPSMDGKLHVDVEQGQFLKADPGLAKLLSVLSLQALPRRLTLDFRDVFSEGFAFDFIRGDADIARGVASTNNLQMKGVSAAALMDGSAEIAHETQSLRVVVVPEINAGTASLVATAINPAIGLATFLAQMALRKPLIAAATQEFQIDGTWADPKITKMPHRPTLAAPADPLPREAQTETKP